MFRKFVLAVTVAACAGLLSSSTSKAAFLLKLESGGNTATIDLDSLTNKSGGSGGSGGSAYSYDFFNIKTVNGVTTATFTELTFGGYTITTDTNQTNLPGTQSKGFLSLTSLQVTRSLASEAASASDLKISLTVTDYTLPTPQKSFSSAFNVGVTSAGTATVAQEGFYDSSNAAFGTGVVNSYTTTASNLAQSANPSKSLSGSSGSYSITNTVSIQGLTAGESLSNASVTSTVVAPAPAGLILAATALPFFGLLRRRLRKSDVATVA